MKAARQQMEPPVRQNMSTVSVTRWCLFQGLRFLWNSRHLSLFQAQMFSTLKVQTINVTEWPEQQNEFCSCMLLKPCLCIICFHNCVVRLKRNRVRPIYWEILSTKTGSNFLIYTCDGATLIVYSLFNFLNLSTLNAERWNWYQSSITSKSRKKTANKYISQNVILLLLCVTVHTGNEQWQAAAEHSQSNSPAQLSWYA